MYLKAENDTVIKFPYSIGRLRKDNPNTSFPNRPNSDSLAGFGVFSVRLDKPPAFDETRQRITKNPEPELRAGAWVVGWTFHALSDDELAENFVNSISAAVGPIKRDVQARLDAFARTRDYIQKFCPCDVCV